MTEITKVWERLFVGGQRDAQKLATSNRHRITTVISLCEEQKLRRNPTVNYLHIPIADATPIDIGQFDGVMDAIAENIRWGTVLVHCGSGICRAPIMAAAWMHIVGYKNIDAALSEIAMLRPVVGPSPVLLNSVKELL